MNDLSAGALSPDEPELVAYRVELGFDLTSTAADTVLQITCKLLAADLLLGRLPGRPAG